MSKSSMIVYRGEELPDYYKCNVYNGFTHCVTGKGRTEYAALIDAEYRLSLLTDIEVDHGRGPSNVVAHDGYLYYVEIHFNME